MMLNCEKYKGDLMVYASHNGDCNFCKFIHSKTHGRMNCDSFANCDECATAVWGWLLSEYKEPVIDWSKVPVGTKVRVWNDYEELASYKSFLGYNPTESSYLVTSDEPVYDCAMVVSMYKHCELQSDVDPTPFIKEEN